MLPSRWDEVQTQRTRLRDLDLPCTAHAALREAWPAARAHDPAARCVLITSGEDLDERGRATLWELQVDLPQRRAQATLSIGIDEDDDYGRPCVLVAQVRPFIPPGDLWEIMREGEEAMRRHETVSWQRLLVGRPPLPLPGYDSDHAVAALLAHGGRTGRGRWLGARVQVDGSAVWYLHRGGDEPLTTPFGPAALPAGPDGAAPDVRPPLLPPDSGALLG